MGQSDGYGGTMNGNWIVEGKVLAWQPSTPPSKYTLRAYPIRSIEIQGDSLPS